jgi:hypothetical protein
MECPLIVHRRPSRSQLPDIRKCIELPLWMAPYCLDVQKQKASAISELLKMLKADDERSPKRAKLCNPIVL